MTTNSFEVQLYNNLCTGFSLEDLRTLCFFMSIDHDSLKQDNRDVLAREMVERCRMTGRLPELRDAAQQKRPNPSSAAPHVRTLVVDPLHRGNYPTISEAVANARPGERIEVRPGVYNEAIVIDKPLEIIGNGPIDEIIVRADKSDVIRIDTTMAIVRNLTLHQAGGSWYGVYSDQGYLILEGCDISSRGLSCIVIHDRATATVRRNRIHDNNEDGISVYHHGQGNIEDNDIISSFYGIAIATSANPTVRNNRIYNKGAGTFEGNDLRANAKGAWLIDKSSQSLVKRSNNTE